MRTLIFTLSAVTLLNLSVCANGNHVIDVPHIGKAKVLVDKSGKETKFFIPLEEEQSVNQGIEKQELTHVQSKQYLDWLQQESDPDVRRHYLFEISRASVKDAQWIIIKLIRMMGNEPDENVRKEYITTLSSLATIKGINDSEILNVIFAIKKQLINDPSWNVKIHAAVVLAWYGEKEGVNVIQKVIDENIEIDQNILFCVPAALQRINTDDAKRILLKIRSQSKDDTLKVLATWSTYKLDLVDIEEVLTTAEMIAKNSNNDGARIRAISLLSSITKEKINSKNRIENIIKDLIKNEKKENIKKFSIQTLENMKTK